ncbi:hypothetical protein EST38_g2071 [Candolleomyces aberdarensis]|uniref:Glycosyl transferase family 1 domain-containing protein n=1 Tax=Candolleomyces aberdarensis TaxID=2316362 RepID=A0A4Q2DUI5_9AGAR|nr:hypothetical protein EST38_g2071 [Candolleomyces aberdarensis]
MYWLIPFLAWLAIHLYGSRLRKHNKEHRKHLLAGLGHQEDKIIIGFFHPYSNAGGGGERVLWTAIAHIQRTRPNIVSVVYSGDTDATKQEILAKVKRVILSLAQFRPEKDHPAQLHAFQKLLDENPQFKSDDNPSCGVRLVLIGGSRNDGDRDRVAQLRGLAGELGVEPYVDFIVNAPYSTVLEWLSKASIGLSTMQDEHFGINIVEYMAAGVIPVTHASGGPLKDIVVPVDGKPSGFHAKTPAGFAEALKKVLSLSGEEELEMRRRARQWAVQRFSEEEFEKGWDSCKWDRYLP